MTRWEVDVELEDEEGHPILVAGALFHDAKHFVPAIDELLQIAVRQDDFMQACNISHIFILVVHGEIPVRHPQHLAACDVSFMELTLLALGLFDLLSEEVGIPRNRPHECC